MRIHVTVRHCELDPEDRLFTEQRLEKLGRFVRDIQEAHVTVTAEKYRHTAEITLRLRGQEIVGREQANGARTAVDRAADRLEEQIRRLKDKRLERRRGDRARAVDQMDSTPEPEGETWDERGMAADKE
jgi:putative sigma-54 modulation protein